MFSPFTIDNIIIVGIYSYPEWIRIIPHVNLFCKGLYIGIILNP